MELNAKAILARIAELLSKPPDAETLLKIYLWEEQLAKVLGVNLTLLTHLFGPPEQVPETKEDPKVLNLTSQDEKFLKAIKILVP